MNPNPGGGGGDNINLKKEHYIRMPKRGHFTEIKKKKQNFKCITDSGIKTVVVLYKCIVFDLFTELIKN